MILGIDPGLNTTGYALLTVTPEGPRLREAGVIRTTSDSIAERVCEIHHDLCEVIEAQRPTAMALEQLYTHYDRPKTAILMGHARGVILAVAARFDIEVRSFTATQVKRYLTGNGRASKAQIQRAIKATLGLSVTPEPDDVADALAVALCCAHAVQHERLEVGRK